MEHASETEVTDAGKHVRSLFNALNQVAKNSHTIILEVCLLTQLNFLL